jgi:hypothetical protein
MKFALSSCEQRVLFQKYISEGLGYENAKARLKLIQEILRSLVLSLKKKGKIPEEINSRFKKEFEKLVQKT